MTEKRGRMILFVAGLLFYFMGCTGFYGTINSVIFISGGFFFFTIAMVTEYIDQKIALAVKETTNYSN